MIRVWGFVALVFMLSECADFKSDQVKDRPNIIFILADDMGYNVAGAYGGSEILTPNIDQLAADGMMFTNSYAGNPVCAPSRASLMTGYHNGHASLRGNTGGIPIPDEDFTLAELLKTRGYKTGLFGKWGLGDVETEGAAEKQGFDEVFGYYHQIHAHYYHTDYLWHNGKKVDVPNILDAPESYSHNIIMDKMVSFIRDNKDEPFFAFGSWTIPHSNEVEVAQIPPSDPSYLLYQNKDWSENDKKYAAMNTMVDAGVGQLRSLISELGIEDNTIIIFASDNGGDQMFDERFNVSGKLKGFKRQLYEGGIKVPLIYYWSGKIKPGTISEVQNYFADFMPTFADIAGANEALPNDLDGISIAPTLFDGDQQQQHEYLYWELPNFDWSKNIYDPEGLQQAIRVDDWKLLRHKTTEPWELYNLKDDPYEEQNIARENPEIVERLIDIIDKNRTNMSAQIEPDMPEGKEYR